MGRGNATLDPLLLLAAAAGETSTIELGTCVLQVPLRHPVELAQRVQSLDLLSGGRLRLGVGAGSTEADFLALQADYAGRFKTLRQSLDVMQRSWRGEAIFGPAVTPWPGHEDGPPLFLGSWHSPQWIDFAAQQCQGWMGSGIYSTWEGLETGIKMYRDAGGTRVLLANIFTDLRPEPVVPALIGRAKIKLICNPAEARDRLTRLADMGVDDALVICPFDQPEQLEQIRDLAPT
jgi:alkanesulfonate monooxygenase SsuD/methylene tetrahydromethanopterin reductase-like flavin-dependent oxidoreductase (luciferase family)